MAPSTRSAVGASSLDFLFLEDFPPIFFAATTEFGDRKRRVTHPSKQYALMVDAIKTPVATFIAKAVYLCACA